MSHDASGLQLKVRWKLEKFDGEKQPDSLPVEVLEGEEILPQAMLKEFQDALDEYRS